MSGVRGKAALVVLLTLVSTAIVLAAALVTFAYLGAVKRVVARIEDIEPAESALVLGAAVQRDKRPSPILRERVDTAVELLKNGKVSTLLLSGDSRQAHYDEVAAMERTAIELGARPEVLLHDFNGYRTFDSCLHAKGFGITSVVVVTQYFHLPRAIYLCQAAGLEVQGLAADRDAEIDSWHYDMREAGAWILAVVETHWHALTR